MRVGILSYPMLFQRDGGLQIQVRETIAALNSFGADPSHPLQAQLVDPNRERLDAFDLIHVFSAINGNFRLVEAASEMGVPVVWSPLLPPLWTRASGFGARMADRLTCCLTAWNVQTSYAQTKRALQLAKLVIALGDAEREAITSGFLVDPAKIRVFPNGISRHFFTSQPELFCHHTGITGPFVLMVGSINPYKNQLGLVQALADMKLPVVLIGRVARQDQAYLDTVLRSPWVRWLGALNHDDPLLASAYRAASVLALPSHGEVFPLAVLESLAAGTPVVMTDENALDLQHSAFALRTARWHDAATQRTAIRDFIDRPPEREAVRALVEHYTWQRVAAGIANCYVELAASLQADKPEVAEQRVAALHGEQAIPVRPMEEPESTSS
jgi:glycosyltransferase involved in cell wall biosynthesis